MIPPSPGTTDDDAQVANASPVLAQNFPPKKQLPSRPVALALDTNFPSYTDKEVLATESSTVATLSWDTAGLEDCWTIGKCTFHAMSDR